MLHQQTHQIMVGFCFILGDSAQFWAIRKGLLSGLTAMNTATGFLPAFVEFCCLAAQRIPDRGASPAFEPLTARYSTNAAGQRLASQRSGNMKNITKLRILDTHLDISLSSYG
jgi:hypothetical protein